MPTETKPENRTVMIDANSHKRAQLAANLEEKTLVQFLSEAADRAAGPILRDHGIDPKKIEAAN